HLWKRRYQIKKVDEEFIRALINCGQFKEAVECAKNGFEEIIFELYMEHGHLIDDSVEQVLRSHAEKATENSGLIWCSLASIMIKKGRFESARRIYNEAIGKVRNVRDFSIVFDSYGKFEEALL